jgi:hypothetical protein
MTEFVVEYSAGHPLSGRDGQRFLVGTSALDLSAALAPDLDEVVGDENLSASRAEQEARASTLRSLEAALAADRRWLLDLGPPEYFVSILAEENAAFVCAPELAGAIFDPHAGGARARQIARRRVPISEQAIRQARDLVAQDFQKRGSDSLGRTLIALDRHLPARLFEVDADTEAKVAAAKAELAAAETLDQQLVFNQAAVRGAALALDLAARAAEARKAWLTGAAEAIKATATLSKPKYYWLCAKLKPEESPEGPQ